MNEWIEINVTKQVFAVGVVTYDYATSAVFLSCNEKQIIVPFLSENAFKAEVF